MWAPTNLEQSHAPCSGELCTFWEIALGMLLDPSRDRALGHEHQVTMHLKLLMMSWVLLDQPSYGVGRVQQASTAVGK